MPRIIASLAEIALKFLEMAQLDYVNQENNEDDDSPIQYQTPSQLLSVKVKPRK